MFRILPKGAFSSKFRLISVIFEQHHVELVGFPRVPFFSYVRACIELGFS